MNANEIIFLGFCIFLQYLFKDELNTASYFQDTSSSTLSKAGKKFIYGRSKSCHGDSKKNTHIDTFILNSVSSLAGKWFL